MTAYVLERERVQQFIKQAITTGPKATKSEVLLGEEMAVNE